MAGYLHAFGAAVEPNAHKAGSIEFSARIDSRIERLYRQHRSYAHHLNKTQLSEADDKMRGVAIRFRPRLPLLRLYICHGPADAWKLLTILLSVCRNRDCKRG